MSEKTQRKAPYKQEIIKKLLAKLAEYEIVGIANMENLPAPQLQNMRRQLGSKVDMFMTKMRLMKIALEQSKKPGMEKLIEHLKGMPALVFTKENPFAIYKVIKKNKSPAPAKAGQTAPNDITIPAGATPFVPGPVIGELGALGIKAGVEGGKVAIKEDALVCKTGDTISAPLAAMLTRLDIQPMEIGLDIVAMYEGGTVYLRDVLDIDEEQFLANLQTAASQAVNLAVEVAYPTSDTVELMLQKAFRESKALGTEANILADALVEELVGKAEREMLAVKAAAKIPEAPEEPKEAPKEEPKEEKPKEEPPKEEPKPEPKPEPAEQPKPEPEKPPKEEPAPPKAEEPKEEKKEEPTKEKKEEKPPAPKEEPPKEEPPAEAKEPEKPPEPPKEEPKPEKPEPKEEKKENAPKEEKESPNTSQKSVDQEEVAKIVEDLKKDKANIDKKITEEKKQEEAEAKKKSEMEEVENLTSDLMKKGTLRS